eukprot:2883161-Pyramimonas_sp.AAC.1
MSRGRMGTATPSTRQAKRQAEANKAKGIRFEIPGGLGDPALLHEWVVAPPRTIGLAHTVRYMQLNVG